MADFSKINENESYPSASYDGQENQSYGFNPAFKLQSGNTRGTQGVGFGGTSIDGAHNRIRLNANNTQVTIGDTSDTDSLTGVALYDPSTQKNLVTLGRDGTSGSSTTGLTAYDGTGTRRMLAGTYPDGTVKIKLSQVGNDVATATDDQLIWSSDFNTFKIIQTGTFPVAGMDAAGGANDVVTTVFNTLVPSNVPVAYTAYISNDSGGYNQLPVFSFNYSGFFQLVRTTALELSGGFINIRVFSQNFTGSPVPANTVKYYLLKESVV